MKLLIIKKSTLIALVFVISVFFMTGFYVVTTDDSALNVFLNNDRKLPIYSVETKEKRIAISFDAAWGADQTEELLKILKQYNVKTTFFLVAFWTDKYPEMVKRISDEGHEIGNHSASHPQMSRLSETQMTKELTDTSKKIQDITGKPVTLFRPPFGDYNNRLIQTCKDLGYQVIQWDVDSLDYKDYGADSIVQKVLSKVREGSIVLFHNNATYTKEALPIILKKLQADGYTIVPISELIYKENYYIDHTGRQIPLIQMNRPSNLRQ